MRYFFLAYAIIAVLVVGLLGLRGDKFARPPLRVFPDMDNQDVVKAQVPDNFFADGRGARLPVAGTQPVGFHPLGEKLLGGIPEYEFSGGTGYYYTGEIGDYYGNGMPEELGLKAENVAAFLRRGQERFNIYCSACHGVSGDGQGMTSNFGVPVAANPNAKLAETDGALYPDGRLFATITKGKGNMSGYGYNIPVRDRWAIIGYIHALRTARKAPYEAVKEAWDKHAAAK
jgi:mono/diheme cytochrome c family protein